jgi:hypothetical protein
MYHLVYIEILTYCQPTLPCHQLWKLLVLPKAYLRNFQITIQIPTRKEHKQLKKFQT